MTRERSESWEVDSYKEGKWTVSVRRNTEIDRLDEGVYPENRFHELYQFLDRYHSQD
jgi:hypothetical protein